MAAAPTPATAALIARNASSVALPQTATLADLRILMGLMMLTFSLMAATCYALWRRSFKDFLKTGAKRRAG